MVGFDIFPAPPQVYYSTQPSLSTGEFPFNFTVKVLPSSAPAYLEYEVHRLSIKDQGKGNALSQPQSTPISNWTDLQNCGVGGKVALSPQPDDNIQVQEMPYGPCKKEQAQHSHGVNGGHDAVKLEAEQCDGAFSETKIIQEYSRESVTDSLLCGNSNKDTHLDKKDESITSETITHQSLFQPENVTNEPPLSKTPFTVLNNSLPLPYHETFNKEPTETFSQNSDSLFDETELQHFRDEEHNQQSDSNHDHKKCTDSAYLDISVPKKISTEKESERVEGEILPQGKCQVNTNLGTFSPNKNTDMSPDTSDVDKLNTVAFELKDFTNHEANVNPISNKISGHDNRLYTSSEGDHPFETSEGDVQRDNSEESVPQISSGIQIGRNLDIKEHDIDLISESTALNIDNTINTQTAYPLVVTPQVCSPQPAHFNQHIMACQAPFENDDAVDQDCGISFSPLCNGNEGFNSGKSVTYYENADHISLKEKENNTDSCLVTEGEVRFSQNEEGYKGDEHDIGHSHSITKPEENDYDIASTQPFFVTHHNMPLELQNSTNNQQNVTLTDDLEQEQEYAFSPRYTHAHDFHNYGEILNQVDIRLSESQAVYDLIKVSPLKRHLALTDRPSEQNVLSTKEQQVQSESDALSQNNRAVEGSQISTLVKKNHDDSKIKGNTVVHHYEKSEAQKESQILSSSELSSSSRNCDIMKDRHSLMVFSPLVKEKQHTDCIVIRDDHEVPATTVLPQEEQSRASVFDNTNHLVPSYGRQRVQTEKETLLNLDENFPEHDIETSKEMNICENQRVGKDCDSRDEIPSGPLSRNEVDGFDKASCGDSITLRVEGRKKSNEHDTGLIKAYHDNAHRDSLYKGFSNSGLNNPELCSSMVNEQVVPGNNLIAIGHEDCNDQSLYDKGLEGIKHNDGKQATVILEPHRSSFHWKSVYEAVLMNNNNESTQHTTTDHLETISPLPQPSQMKRCRSLRVGLSKKQKVRPLHDK